MNVPQLQFICPSSQPKSAFVWGTKVHFEMSMYCLSRRNTRDLVGLCERGARGSDIGQAMGARSGFRGLLRDSGKIHKAADVVSHRRNFDVLCVKTRAWLVCSPRRPAVRLVISSY